MRNHAIVFVLSSLAAAEARAAVAGLSARPAREAASALLGLRGGAAEPSDAMLHKPHPLLKP